jgi:putative ABC transport system substrate-binding protein
MLSKGPRYIASGFWHAESREGEGPIFEAFIAGLRERGYVEGRNILFAHRFAAEMPERFRAMAGELVALKSDLLVGVSPPSAVALKNTGTSIPIVFTVVGGDPVALGLVPSYTRPDGNITGFTILTPDLVAKRLQLLVEILPGLKRVGVLYNPDNPSRQRILREVAEATQTLALEPQLLLWLERKHIARSAVAVGIAEGQFTREGAEAGSLFAYGPNLPEVARQTSDYVVKILLGTAPRDLPVVQPTRFELVINLKTAKTLRLTIPPSLLLRADQVIE